MRPYQPIHYRHPALAQAAVAPAVAPAAPAVAGPAINTGKIVTSAITLGVVGAASYFSFKGASASKKTTTKVAGYVGGVGSLLLGLAVVAAAASMPDVTTTLTKPFALTVSG